MKKRTRILFFIFTLVFAFSLFTLSAAAYSVGGSYSLKDSYTFEELEILFNSGDKNYTANSFDYRTLGISSNVPVSVIYSSSSSSIPGDFTVIIYSDDALADTGYSIAVIDNGVYSFTSPCLSGKSVALDYDGYFSVKSGALSPLSSNTSAWNLCFEEYIVPADPAAFVNSATSGISSVIGWISSVVNAIVTKEGALYPLLALFAIPIAISAILFGIKAIRNITWGA